MSKINVKQIMLDIPKYFNAEKAKGVSGTVQCMFTGDQASDWVIKIEDRQCSVSEGTTNHADLTIKADAEVGVKILTKQMDPMRAYMLGKVKVFGDLSLGMKLTNFFDQN